MQRAKKRTALLFMFFALILTAASGGVVWGFLGPGNNPPSFDNGSYQIRSADDLERSSTNNFREDMEYIEPGTYRTEGWVGRNSNTIGPTCYYVLLEFAGNFPMWTFIGEKQEFRTTGPATVTLPTLNRYDLPRGGFYSKDCEPWKRVEDREVS